MVLEEGNSGSDPVGTQDTFLVQPRETQTEHSYHPAKVQRSIAGLSTELDLPVRIPQRRAL